MSEHNHRSLVLCVDDETVGLHFRKVVLESKGYRVLTADNGPEALALFCLEPVDLVILDHRMPGMDGSVVAERMKQLKPSVPILMLSAYLDVPSETLRLVDKYVTKGQPPSTMLEVVAELLGRGSATSG